MKPDRIAELQAQLKRHPQDAGVHYELGRAYLALGDTVQAEAALLQALCYAPQHPQILMQLGNTASQAGLETKASDFFKQSLAVDPTQADVHFNLANSLRKQQQVTSAIAHYQRAIQLKPNDADYHNNLGNAYRELGALDLAIAAYAEALRHQPAQLHSKVHWIHQKQHSADWQGLEAAIAQVQAALKQHTPLKIPPFAFLAMPGTSDAEQTLCASLWAQAQYGHITPLPPPRPRANATATGTRIKVAYLSSDFRRHPLASLVTEVIQHHHRDQFEVYLYQQALADDSAEQAAFKAAADHWVEIHAMSDQAVAAHMREADIDIVVDLTGYTQNSRTGVVAYRPARLHINWLGYAGSMGRLHGRPLFDAILVDATLNMPQLAEKPLLLPCYQPNNALYPLDAAGTRADHNLPATGFVFFCFNQSFKITPSVFSHWLSILKQVPDSVLWLLESNAWAVKHLQAAARRAGVDVHRLVFAPRVSAAAHLARQQHADLMLDTLPYNAHTTASDALRAGVPLLTVCGETFASRVSASLLSHIGLSELICADWPSYCAKAVSLAQSPDNLASLKAKLLQQRGVLFDPKQFVIALEAAYQQALNAGIEG